MFITFEGGEGAGKSTLIDKVEKLMLSHGLEVVKTRAPGGTPLGKDLREMILHPPHGIHIGTKAELMLYLADRAQHIEEVIKPALDKGKVVLCDRFNDSTVAYQGGARGLGFDEVRELCNLVCGGIVPTLTFFLDIDPTVAFTRIKGSFDRLEQEKMDFHHEVRKSFQKIATLEPNRFHLIDATQTPDAVFAEASAAIESLVK